MLLQGRPYDGGLLSAYFEGDLNASGVTSTTVQTNSYSPRVRQAFAELDDLGTGLHLTAGQAYSLATPNAFGLVPRREQLPLTIDSGYVPGFVYTRQPQIRLTKDFNNQFWIGASLETPQTMWAFNSGTAGKGTSAVTTMPAGIGAASGGVLDITNAGSGGLNATTSYSIDHTPDFIVKAAADPGFGHYEVYGLVRTFNDRLAFVGSGSNKTTVGGGIGGATTVPVVPGLIDFTANALAGYGVGRYGAGQLPDATVGKDGQPVPLPEVEALVGLVGHPTPKLDLFGYAGAELIGREVLRLRHHRLRLRQPAVRQQRLRHRAVDGLPRQQRQHPLAGRWHDRLLVSDPAGRLRHLHDRRRIFVRPAAALQRQGRRALDQRTAVRDQPALPALAMTARGRPRG